MISPILHQAMALLFVMGTLSACSLPPLEVAIRGEGLTKIGAVGEKNRVAVTTRDLRFDKEILKKGTRLVVVESWWIRRKGGGGYRVAGKLEPDQKAGGVVLPPGSVDVFYLGLVEPGRKASIPFPASVADWVDGP
jgi:hypothetical protein